jgi:hypothetical protein
MAKRVAAKRTDRKLRMNTCSRSALICRHDAASGSDYCAGERWAPTPAQMEYDRQQREYWKQQEQQRQEQERLQKQMNENARRQQEEGGQWNAPTAPGQSSTPAQGTAPQRGSPQSSGDALEAARQTWLKRPPLPPDPNPLLGRWTRPPTGKGNSSDPFAALQSVN